MYHDVINVKCEDNFMLRLTFDDGKSGVMDCRSLIAKGGVFSKLQDPSVFSQAQINTELGVVTWNDDIDIAPETAYSMATGAPLPSWMETSEQEDELDNFADLQIALDRFRDNSDPVISSKDMRKSLGL